MITLTIIYLFKRYKKRRAERLLATTAPCA